MTPEETRAFVRRHLATMERQDGAALAADYAEPCEVESPMFGNLESRAAIEASAKSLLKAFADTSYHIDEILVDSDDGDRAAAVLTIHHTHKGELFGMPGTGRRVEIRAVFVFRFAGRLICSETRLYDFTGLLVQLGVLKARAS